MLLMVIISLLFMNLFVGIVTEAFKKEKFLMSYNHLLKPIQRDFIQVQLLTLRASPRKMLNRLDKRAGRLQRWSMWLIHTYAFRVAVNANILINMIVVAFESYKNSTTFANVIFTVNAVCFLLMCIEIIIKIIAMRRLFFEVKWEVLNFFLVLLPIFFESLGMVNKKWNFRQFLVICTVLRSSRIMFTSGLRKVKTLFLTIFQVLPAVGSLAFLLFIVIFIYAVICVHYFSTISLIQGAYELEIGYDANFRDFLGSFLTMFRSVTGEAWPSIMFETARGNSILFACVEDETYDSIVAAGRDPKDLTGPDGCGNYQVSYLIHLSFQVFVAQIFLNLFTAIFIDGFVLQNQVDDLPVTHETVKAFIEEWVKLDHRGTSYI